MKLEQLKTVAVIGAGDMGHGIAQVALMAGYHVNLCDIQQAFVDRGISRIYASLDKLVSKGKFPAERFTEIQAGGISSFTVIEEAVKDAQFIIEAVPERLDIKDGTLRRISAACSPDAVIATNSSTMSITLLAKSVKDPSRMLGTHYFNPAVLMRLVEVICGDETSEQTMLFAKAYAEHAGKTVVVAKKDRPGFIANRIVAPVVVYNGLCVDRDGITPADIDLSMMKTGQKMGPMELADYTGIDVTSFCQDYYHIHLSPEYEPSDVARKLMSENHLGKKTGSGYYVWPEKGRPVIDESLYTGRYDPRIPNFIQANEACKLFEEGVCSLEECDTAIELGYNMRGPIDCIQGVAPEEIVEALNRVADHFGKEIFLPTHTIAEGGYLR